MTPETQRIAIAEACGFTEVRITGIGRTIPDYPNDLNAMHEAENGRLASGRLWMAELAAVVGFPNFVPPDSDEHEEMILAMLHATAAQRAQAFLKTLGLWKD